MNFIQHPLSVSTNNQQTFLNHDKRRSSRLQKCATDVEFNYAEYVKEHHDMPLYHVEFCHYLKPNQPNKFATVGSNKITIYECQPNKMLALKCYSDPNKNEVFYTCCWSYDPNTFDIILVAAGLHGVIRIIYPTAEIDSKSLTGHHNPINDLKFHPKNPTILLSSSKDRSLRLWNIDSNVCIAIFGGVEGHRDQVVSVDFDTVGDRIVSGGIDNSMKIWRLDKSPMKEMIESSVNFKGMEDKYTFRTYTEHFPDFSTRDVHRHIIDCVRWFGNLILSKSLENCIICWKPEPLTETSHQLNSYSEIHRFYFNDCNVWYMKFSLDVAKKYMTVGNMKGEMFLWSLESENPTKYKLLKHPRCCTAVRKTAFSPDGKVLICVCEDSTVWRWNIK